MTRTISLFRHLARIYVLRRGAAGVRARVAIPLSSERRARRLKRELRRGTVSGGTLQIDACSHDAVADLARLGAPDALCGILRRLIDAGPGRGQIITPAERERQNEQLSALGRWYGRELGLR